MKHKQMISRPATDYKWKLLGDTNDAEDDDDDDPEPGEYDFLYQLGEEDADDDDDGYYDKFDDNDSDFGFEDDDSDVGSEKRSKSILLLGYVCAVVAPLLRAVSAACAQALNGIVPPLQLSLMRYAAQMVFVIPFICSKKLSLVPGRRDLLWLVIAAILNNANNATYYGACVHLPVGVAGGTMATLSIIWATIVTLIVSGKVKLHTAAAGVICIAGIVLLVQPQFLFHELLPSATLSTYSLCGEERHSEQIQVVPLTDTSLNDTSNVTTTEATKANHNSGLGQELTGFIMLLISSLASVTVTVIMRYRLKDCNPFISVLWFGACGVVLSALVMPLSGTPTFPKTPLCIAFMFSHSCAASISSIFSMIAMMLISPLGFYLLHSLEMLFLASAQYTLLKHLKPGHRNAVELVGMCLVFISSLTGPGYSGFKGWNSDKKANEKEEKKKKKRTHY